MDNYYPQLIQILFIGSCTISNIIAIQYPRYPIGFQFHNAHPYLIINITIILLTIFLVSLDQYYQ